MENVTSCIMITGVTWSAIREGAPPVKNPLLDHLKFINQCYFQYDVTKS